MKINLRIWTRSALVLALFVLAAGTRAALAQDTLTGTWTATFGDKSAARKFSWPTKPWTARSACCQKLIWLGTHAWALCCLRQSLACRRMSV